MPIRDLHAEDADACDEIVRGLPHFFGSEAGNAACAAAVRSQRGWVADEAGRVDGFLVVDYPLPAAPEITWMAVRSGQRRRGLGRQLINRAVRELRAHGDRVLSVLTLSESVPEMGDDTYEGTRAFYRAVGFQPVREISPPEWDSPALLLVASLAGG